MVYLITHIAISLLFAQLLGLLLGWLFWGYLARQRGAEVETLRARLTDFQVMAPRRSFSAEQRTALPATPESSTEATLPSTLPAGPLIEDDLGREPLATPRPMFLPDATLPPPVPDLKAEVQEARLQHYEKQIQELEGIRDRLPQLQSRLDEALAARRSLENQLTTDATRFETRIDDLLGQVRQFEQAAYEWDRTREEWERSQGANEKELATVKAHLRDLQNNQLPQKADPIGTVVISPLEHADLRERYQKALLERDALAAQCELLKRAGEGQDGSPALSVKIAELEELLHAKEVSLADQASRVETLLWRVAELEPLATALPGLEENLQRQEAEISGHVAMHTESADHIRNLLNRVAELEADTARLAERDAEIVRLKQAHLADVSEKDSQLQRLTAAHAALEIELRRAEERANESERTAGARWADLEQLREAHDRQAADLERLKAGWDEAAGRLAVLTPLADKAPALEASLLMQTSEVQRLTSTLGEREAERQRLAAVQAALDQQLTVLAARLAELEPLAAQVPDLQTALALRDSEREHLTGALASREADLRATLAARDQSQAACDALKDRNDQLTHLENELRIDLQRLQEENIRQNKEAGLLLDRLSSASGQLVDSHLRLQELEPLAAQAPEFEQKLLTLQTQHQNERARLQAHSAQRLRRLRQSITIFKG